MPWEVSCRRDQRSLHFMQCKVGLFEVRVQRLGQWEIDCDWCVCSSISVACSTSERRGGCVIRLPFPMFCHSFTRLSAHPSCQILQSCFPEGRKAVWQCWASLTRSAGQPTHTSAPLGSRRQCRACWAIFLQFLLGLSSLSTISDLFSFSNVNQNLIY